jgi:predicted nucleic acid-binding protein
VTIVCNATPLINFAAINRLDILQTAFRQVVIPQAVYDALAFASRREAASLRVLTSTRRVLPLQRVVLHKSYI